MTIKAISVGVTGPNVTAANISDQTALASAVSDAIDTATTANGVAGAKADVTSELADIGTALTALTANQLAGALTVSVDTSLVTTRSQLRKLMDEAYRYFADSQSFLS